MTLSPASAGEIGPCPERNEGKTVYYDMTRISRDTGAPAVKWVRPVVDAPYADWWRAVAMRAREYARHKPECLLGDKAALFIGMEREAREQLCSCGFLGWLRAVEQADGR